MSCRAKMSDGSPCNRDVLRNQPRPKGRGFVKKNDVQHAIPVSLSCFSGRAIPKPPQAELPSSDPSDLLLGRVDAVSKALVDDHVFSMILAYADVKQTVYLWNSQSLYRTTTRRGFLPALNDRVPAPEIR